MPQLFLLWQFWRLVSEGQCCCFTVFIDMAPKDHLVQLSQIPQGKAPHACTLCASCCDGGCPVPHQSTATASPVVPLTLSGHQSWTAPELHGNGMGLWGQLELQRMNLVHTAHNRPSSLPPVPFYAHQPTCHAHHPRWGVSTRIRKQVSSLVPAFPKDPTSVISPSVVRSLHWPLWDTPSS